MVAADQRGPAGTGLHASGSTSWTAALAARAVRGQGDRALYLLDAVLVAMAFSLMLVVRYGLAVPAHARTDGLLFVPVAIALALVVNRLVGLYGPVWEQAGVLEAQRLLVAGLVTTATLTGWMLIGPRLVPMSVALTGGLAATGLMGLLRFQARLFAFNRRAGQDATRVLLVGAGEAGGAMLREIERTRDSGAHVAAIVDDDPRKVGRWVGATPVAGCIDDLAEVGRAHEVDQVLLAIPSADSALVRRVADQAAELGVGLKVLPGVTELINGAPQLRDLRELSIDDLLGRQPVDTDLDAVAALVQGRRVVVTGGGGSIGAEIVRQVAAYGPARLVVLDRDETHLFDALAAIDGAGEAALLDIRDRDRLRALFADIQPEIVFHAAANKHVPMLEDHPSEAASTNVLGAANLADTAREVGVAHLVFVSTDKAVQPSSVMGASKRVGEQLILSGAPKGAAWCAVRFGNVLGSRGSVVPTFLRQIHEGGPVTLTHPEMSRYFMSIPEAVQLVLQAAALAEDREVFMLDMGEPVRIMDLATRMITLAGRQVGVDVPIEITGLRPGEKLAEELHTPQENPIPTAHPKVMRLHNAIPRASDAEDYVHRLTAAVRTHDDESVRHLLLTGLEPVMITRSPETATARIRGRAGRNRAADRRLAAPEVP